LCGLKERQYNKHRRHLSMMFQDPIGSLSPRLTVCSLITEPFKVHAEKSIDVKEKEKQLLDMVGLPESFTDHYPHQLSGGQARRVEVARALALSPKLIVADEPTAGLDVSVQGEVLNLMGNLQAKHGIGYLVITHNLSIVRHISDHMAIMYLGRLVEFGSTEQIFSQPCHPYTKVLLAANPITDPDKCKKEVSLIGEIPSLLNRPSGCEFHNRCPQVKSVCKTDRPPIVTLEQGHWARCHCAI